MARSPKTIYCGPNCNAATAYERKRASKVIYLTAEVFDSWFCKAA